MLFDSNSLRKGKVENHKLFAIKLNDHTVKIICLNFKDELLKAMCDFPNRFRTLMSQWLNIKL